MGIRISNNNRLWTNGVVPFEINATDFPIGTANRTTVEDAIRHWNDRTAVRLVARNGESDFVTFRAATGACNSPVGRQSGDQAVHCAVGTGFGLGSVIHEIGHALGLWHEHSREDRDSFITVNTANIQAGQAHNFDRHVADGDDLAAYDYNSIMHYGRAAFSSNGMDTIVPVDASATIGQRTALSGGDILAINMMYTRTRFVLQTGTALHETDGTFCFLLSLVRDLYAIKKSGTGTHSTEIHRLSAASHYQSFTLHSGTALHETDHTWAFGLATNNDLFAFKKSGTGSHSTEIHVLSAANGYQSFRLQTGTCLHETGPEFDFLVAGNRDVYAIKKSSTGSGSTEVHVLSAASNYQQFSLQTGTALHPTDHTFDFALSPGRDLYAFKKSGCGTHTTEVHRLSAASGYQSFNLQQGTVLHETDQTFQILGGSSGRMYAIKKSGTGTHSTEVHVVTF